MSKNTKSVRIFEAYNAFNKNEFPPILSPKTKNKTDRYGTFSPQKYPKNYPGKRLFPEK